MRNEQRRFRETAERNLCNDLDLVLIDPDGNPHYPWLLDQVAFGLSSSCIPTSLGCLFFPVPISNEAQACGDGITVRRNLIPTNNPNFVAMAKKLGIDFKGHPKFTKVDIDERQSLIQRICEVIWESESRA